MKKLSIFLILASVLLLQVLLVAGGFTDRRLEGRLFSLALLVILNALLAKDMLSLISPFYLFGRKIAVKPTGLHDDTHPWKPAPADYFSMKTKLAVLYPLFLAALHFILYRS